MFDINGALGLFWLKKAIDSQSRNWRHVASTASNKSSVVYKVMHFKWQLWTKFDHDIWLYIRRFIRTLLDLYVYLNPLPQRVWPTMLPWFALSTSGSSENAESHGTQDHFSLGSFLPGTKSFWYFSCKSARSIFVIHMRRFTHSMFKSQRIMVTFAKTESFICNSSINVPFY